MCMVISRVVLVGTLLLCWRWTPDAVADDIPYCLAPGEPATPLLTPRFFAYKPGAVGELRNRDLEFLWSASYSPGSSDLSATERSTLNNYGLTLAQVSSNPFGAPYPDIRLVHDIFHPSGAIYNPDPTSPGFLIGPGSYSVNDRKHVDYYIFVPGCPPAQPQGDCSPDAGSYTSEFYEPKEDVSTGHPEGEILHSNSLMVKGPEPAVATDPTGTGWTRPDQPFNTGFDHEFQHSLPAQRSFWSTEMFSGIAELVGGQAPGIGHVAYTWSLLGDNRFDHPVDLCVDPVQVGLNYQGRRLFGAYLAFNFRGADLAPTLPTSPSDHTGFGDDLVWYWAHTGENGRLLIDLQILLGDNTCGTCQQKTYFHPGGTSLPAYDRFQLLHHNWRVANYVNNPYLAEGEYGYPTQFGFSPWQTLGAWNVHLEGCPKTDMVGTPPKATMRLTPTGRQLTFVGSRRSDDNTYTYPMTLQPLGAEYWVIRSDPALASSLRSYDLQVRVLPEGILTDLCTSGAQRDGRLVASVIGYSDESDSLFKHPEWARTVAEPPLWVDADSLAGALEFIVPSFGKSNKAALVVISLGDGPSQAYASINGLSSNREVQALPYRLSLALQRTPTPIPENPQPNPFLLVHTAGGDDDFASWSPASDEVAFQSTRGLPVSQIWRQKLNETTPAPLIPRPFNQSEPDWSPRGDRVAFVEDTLSASATYSHLWTYNIGATELRELTTGREVVGSPAFQPNGQALAFVRKYVTGPYPAGSIGGWELRRINLDGTGDQMLVNTGAETPIRSVRWSPSGDLVYFTRNDSLYSVTVATPHTVVDRGALVGGAKVSTIDLSPGNGSLVLEQVGTVNPPIWSANCAGQSFRRLAMHNATTQDTEARFYRTSAEFFNPRLSRDGTNLVYSSTQNGPGDRDLFVGRVNFDDPPLFNVNVTDRTLAPGQPFSMDLTATDPDGDPLTYEGAYLPPGSSISGTVFSWPSPTASCGDYHIVFRALDPAGGVAQKVVRLTILPTPVSNLTPSPGRTTAVLFWTEPSQGGCESDEYDLRYSSNTITESSFSTGTPIPVLHSPGPGGTAHCAEVRGLLRCTQYYFAMRTKDRGLWSLLSNIPSIQTKCNWFDPEILCDNPGLNLQSASATGWVPENSLLWESLGSGISDLYNLKGSAGPVGDEYVALLRKVGPGAAELDVVSLGIVDHDPLVQAVASTDQVLVGTVAPVERVSDEAGTDVTSQVNGSAATPYQAAAGRVLDVRLGEASPTTGLIVESEGSTSGLSPDSTGILIQRPDGSRGWQTLAHVQPRVSLDEFAVSSAGSDSLRLLFLHEHSIRSLRRLSGVRTETPNPLAITRAVHSSLGDVIAAVGTRGGATANLLSGDSLTLGFAAIPDPLGKTRELFLSVGGSYISLLPSSRRDLANAQPVAQPEVYEFALGPVRPNPSSGSVNFSFTMAQRGPVSIRVYDVAGRLVRRLLNGGAEPGPHDLVWNVTDDDGRRVGAGVYFYRMVAGSWVSQRKVVFLER